jgi:hypothetical protein
VGLLTPKSRGRLRLRSADPAERAQVDHAYLAAAADVAALAYGVRWALRAIRQPEIAAYLGSPLRSPPDLLDDALDKWIRSAHTHYWHPAGTCRMGPDPAQGAVVDPQGRVHGVRGLRIADASVFPRLPRATPALSPKPRMSCRHTPGFHRVRHAHRSRRCRRDTELADMRPVTGRGHHSPQPRRFGRRGWRRPDAAGGSADAGWADSVTITPAVMPAAPS